jgi:DNA-binding winged helix-turn-helix (wHTH) protein/tetratricopeptide (TPR) repeat protein
MNFPFAPIRGQAPETGENSILIDRWRIDVMSGEIVDLDGRLKARRLEPTPLRLFLLLAARAGNTVCRDELMAATWNRRFISPDSLNTAIHQIRHALDDDARQPRMLQTMPGIGYRLIAEIRPAEGHSKEMWQRRFGRRHLAAAAGVALAAGLIFVVSLQTSEGPATGPVLAPTLSFSEDPVTERMRNNFARQLKAMASKLDTREGVASVQGILIESSIHQEGGKFEAFVHALSSRRNEVLLSRRVRLSTEAALPIPSAELNALELALIEISSPGAHGNLTNLKATDRAIFLRARYLAKEDGYRGLMAASATYDRLLESYPGNLRMMMAGAEANLAIFELGSFSKERLSRAQGLIETALTSALPRALKGDARAMLAQIHFLKDLDVGAAEAGFTEALALSPRNRKARERYARLLRARGNFAAAIREFAYVAAEFNDPSARLEVLRTHYYAGRYTTAIEGAEALAQTLDNKTGAMLLVAAAYEATGDFENAYTWIKKAYGQNDYENDFMAQLEATLETNGPPGYYALVLERILEAEASGISISPARIAGLALAAGEVEAAEIYLARAVEARDPGLYTLRFRPAFKAYVKSNPGHRLITQIGAVARS